MILDELENKQQVQKIAEKSPHIKTINLNK